MISNKYNNLWLCYSEWYSTHQYLGVGGVIRAINTNTSMAWIVALGVAAILILIISLFSIAMPKFKALQKLVDKVNLVMRESLNGTLVIRAFNTQKT